MLNELATSVENAVSCIFKTEASSVFVITWITIVVLSFCIPLTLIIRTFLYRIEIKSVTKRSVFITGCDSGFGNLLAKTLDNKGVRIIAGCLTETGAEELRCVASSRLHALIVDVRDTDSIKRAYEYVKENTGPAGLWGVVNNAGVMPAICPAEWTDIKSFKHVCDVNLFGTISVTLQFLPLLRESRGRLVCVSSVTANCPFPGLANYVVSKTAVKSFAGCIRRELYNTGVTVHTIEPGGFKTNLTDQQRIISMFNETYMEVSDELKLYYGGNISKFLMIGMKFTSTYVSKKPQHVADAMTHALLAKFPKNQYLVGIDTTLLFGIMKLLPEWIDDYILGWPKPYGEILDELQNLK